ncbi:MAG: hypothetical protein ABIP93_01295 [Gemmatimonadaceae bacterium]
MLSIRRCNSIPSRRRHRSSTQLPLTPATVNKSLDHLRKLGIVSELTKRQRGRVFSYRKYVKELSTGT